MTNTYAHIQGMKNILRLSCLAATIFFAGCKSIGPGVLQESHPRYNDAIGSVIERQLLTNLVRLRYHEVPTFLEVSSITENREFGSDIGFDTLQIKPKYNEVTFNTYPMVRDWQRPIISYYPIKGKEFIKRMMTPVPVNIVFEMSLSGWNWQRVFNICIEQINGIKNANILSGTAQLHKQSYERFYKMTSLLKNLDEAEIIKIGRDDSINQLVMKIIPNQTFESEISKFKQLLSLNESKNIFKFENNFLNEDDETLVIKTRSFINILFYLSHAVEVPASDIENGIVQTTVCSDGTMFDCSKHTGGTLLNVHCSKSRPDNAFVSTYCHDHWFFIKNNDLNSKSTFLLLSLLFQLQAGEASSNEVSPMLTIPVSTER